MDGRAWRALSGARCAEYSTQTRKLPCHLDVGMGQEECSGCLALPIDGRSEFGFCENVKYITVSLDDETYRRAMEGMQLKAAKPETDEDDEKDEQKDDDDNGKK